MINDKLSKPIVILHVLTGSLILSGSFYRYLRAVPGYYWIHEIPYMIELCIGGFCLFFVLVKKISLRIHAVPIFWFFFFLFLNFIKVSVQYGLNDQKRFFAQFLLPIVVYWAVSICGSPVAKTLEKVIKGFIVISFVITLSEFVSTNYFGMNIFAFTTYWDEAGVLGYHASAVDYFLLGAKTRPWGIMAMPQSSGALFAACVLFCSVGIRERKTLPYLLISLGGVYVSGSRTALITIFVGWIMLYLLIRKRTDKLFISIILILLFWFVFNSLTTFHNPESSIRDFGISIENAILYLFDSQWHRYLDVFLGQGVVSVSNVVFGLGEIHLINIVFRIGLLPSFFLLLTLLSVILYVGKTVIHDHFKIEVLPWFALLLGMLIGSLHYDCISRYPASVLAWASIGIILNHKYSAINRHRINKSRL